MQDLASLVGVLWHINPRELFNAKSCLHISKRVICR